MCSVGGVHHARWKKKRWNGAKMFVDKDSYWGSNSYQKYSKIMGLDCPQIATWQILLMKKTPHHLQHLLVWLPHPTGAAVPPSTVSLHSSQRITASSDTNSWKIMMNATTVVIDETYPPWRLVSFWVGDGVYFAIPHLSSFSLTVVCCVVSWPTWTFPALTYPR